MIYVGLEGSDLVVTLSGWDTFFTLRRTVRVPLTGIVSVRPAPELIDSRPIGMKMPGSFVPMRPGPLFAGTFREPGGRRTFWARHRASAPQILRIDLGDGPSSGPYRMLVLQVADPVTDAGLISRAIDAARR